MTYQWILAALIALVGTVTTILLGVVISLLLRALDRLDQKQDKTFCEAQEERCGKRFNLGDLWEALRRHSHEGLPAGSKVTR